MKEVFGGVVLSSGMAAVTTAYSALLKSRRSHDQFQCCIRTQQGSDGDHFCRLSVWSPAYVDTSDLEEIRKAIRPNTKMLYLETPANPTMTLTDIEEAARMAHEHGILVVVDNTFSSPYLQKPLKLGADVVLHSLTKFINGHADIVGGALIAKDRDLYMKLKKTMIMMGGNMDPHQAYMVIRGVKTLALRMERAQKNAMDIALYLENHPAVEWVKYPGLDSFVQKDLAEKQMSGYGAMISFSMTGGYEAGVTLMNNVKLALLAVSLGGVETLIQHPASMTHAGLSREAREESGITDGLVRFSVGIENAEDIIEDLEQALNAVAELKAV